MRERRKFLTIMPKDLEVHYYVGSGNGGQKKQKTSSACRIVHKASGAEGKSQDSRKQGENRKLALERLSKSKEFQVWLKIQMDIADGKVKYEEADANGVFHTVDLKPGEC